MNSTQALHQIMDRILPVLHRLNDRDYLETLELLKEECIQRTHAKEMEK